MDEVMKDKMENGYIKRQSADNEKEMKTYKERGEKESWIMKNK